MKKVTLFTVLAFLSLSCVKEREIPCGSFTITTDWGNLPKSVGMSLLFYPVNGGKPIRREITANGYICNLPEGKYRVLLFNNDTKNIRFNNIDTYELAEAYVVPVSKAEQMANQPDMLYGTFIEEINIKQNEPAQNRVKITSYVKNITANINLSADGPAIKNISAQLKGISPSLNLSHGHPLSTTTTGNMEMQASVQSDGNVTVNCATFGICPPTDNPNPTEVPKTVVEIAAVYHDNTQKTVTADISEVIQKIENENEAIIQLKEMGLIAIVTSWKIGSATGSVNK